MINFNLSVLNLKIEFKIYTTGKLLSQSNYFVTRLKKMPFYKDDDRVFKYLKRASADGQFILGHREISKECNIARGNVTHILKRLANQGLIEYTPTSIGTVGNILKVEANA